MFAFGAVLGLVLVVSVVGVVVFRWILWCLVFVGLDFGICWLACLVLFGFLMCFGGSLVLVVGCVGGWFWCSAFGLVGFWFWHGFILGGFCVFGHNGVL